MQRLKFLANQALGPRILVRNGAPRGGSVPSQGARSEYNPCNINMLAIHKQNASSLFWYTQRYQSQGLQSGGYLTQLITLRRRAKDQGPWIADRAPWAKVLLIARNTNYGFYNYDASVNYLSITRTP